MKKSEEKFNSRKRRKNSDSSCSGGILVPPALSALETKRNDENPLLLVLGATPRSCTNSSSRSSEKTTAGRSEEEEEEEVKSGGKRKRRPTVVVLDVEKTPEMKKNAVVALEEELFDRKREFGKEEQQRKMVEQPHTTYSIDPSSHQQQQHHRTTSKIIRREIVIGSPSAMEEDDWSGSISTLPNKQKLPSGGDETVEEEEEEENVVAFDRQPVDLILHVFSFLVGSESFLNMISVSQKWRELTNRVNLCRVLKNTLADGSMNWLNFQNLGVKNKGTEGTCFKCRQRSTGKILAVKRARVFPKGEGVPYYMLRELAVLRGMNHPHIASLEMVNLANDELHVFFPYVDKTLHETINPSSDPNGGTALPEAQSRRFLHQLLDATAYCHRRGVLHRNLKPKHLLIHNKNNMNEAQLLISDFALVRATGLPRRKYTMEVVTLWYRPPEILMGVRGYSPAVDIWSVGCIFAEMAQGKPLFTGISEIDQLFQIFSKLSTPTTESWEEFTSLPNYGFAFPNWAKKPLDRLFPNISPLGLDLLGKLLTYDPDKRITAENALRHPYFNNINRDLNGTGLVLSRKLVPKNISFHHMSKKVISGICLENSLKMDGKSSSTKIIPEHIELFHSFLRTSEISSCKDINYLSRQKTLRPMHRSMLVDWLIEVVDVFEMCLRTAFLAVSYTDRFLNTVMVKKTKFQLLGATCLHVASKCEDVSYIGVEDLAMCADNVYTSIEVLKMEEKLLNTLDFALAIPTAFDFLNTYQAMMTTPIPKKTFMLAQYLSELALQEYVFLKYLPSKIAICALSLAMYCIDSKFWNAELEMVSKYKWSELKKCMSDLQTVYSSSPFTVLAVVKKRYLKADRCHVANLDPPARYNMIS